jgi:hypothetical protein
MSLNKRNNKKLNQELKDLDLQPLPLYVNGYCDHFAYALSKVHNNCQIRCVWDRNRDVLQHCWIEVNDKFIDAGGSHNTKKTMLDNVYISKDAELCERYFIEPFIYSLYNAKMTKNLIIFIRKHSRKYGLNGVGRAGLEPATTPL